MAARLASGAMMVAAAAAPAGAAARPSSLAVTSWVERTAGEGGRATLLLEAARGGRPGERRVFVTRLTEVQRSRSVVAAIPGGVELIDAAGPVLYSVDEGRSFAALERLTVRDGAQMRPARPADVTHLRWSARGPGRPLPGVVLFRGNII